MSLIKEDRKGISKFFHWTHALRFALGIHLFAGLIAHSLAQLPDTLASHSPQAESEANPEEAAGVPKDPLGCETPVRRSQLGRHKKR